MKTYYIVDLKGKYYAHDIEGYECALVTLEEVIKSIGKAKAEELQPMVMPTLM